MKAKIGTKLKEIKEERKLTQEKMAMIMGIDDSAYGRLERNETFADTKAILRYSDKLDVPVEEFLMSELTSFNRNNNYGTAGASIVIGNQYYYASPDEMNRDLVTENTVLKEKIALLEEHNRLLQQLLEQKHPK